MHPFRFAVHTSMAPTMSAWRDQARMAQGLGYSALYVYDHFDAQFGPLVAATVAAEATDLLHVGTLVMNNDFRNPVVLAREIASLGLAAEGTDRGGPGGGLASKRLPEAGIPYDAPTVRVDRLAESLTVMRTLWRDGQVTFEGEYYTVRGARCDPRPAVPPRVIVGGGSRRVLTVAAEQADIVGVNTSLAAGEKGGDTAAMATFDHYDRCLGWIREAAGVRFDSLELQIAAFAVMVVGSRRAALRTATMLGFPGGRRSICRLSLSEPSTSCVSASWSVARNGDFPTSWCRARPWRPSPPSSSAWPGSNCPRCSPVPCISRPAVA